MALPDSSAAHPTSPSHPLFTQVESYPWSSDRDFQSGLAAILGPSPSSSPPSQLEDLTLRARCFYYARRYDRPIDFISYKTWRSAQPSTSLSSLVPSLSTDSPISASSTQSPLWPHTGGPISPPNSNSGGPNSAAVDDEVARSSTLGETLQTNHNGSERVSETALGTAQSAPSSQPSYPSSFEEIMHLIQTGQPIPGIKEIPDTVLLGQGTEATRVKRKKPWEKEESGPRPSATNSRP